MEYVHNTINSLITVNSTTVFDIFRELANSENYYKI